MASKEERQALDYSAAMNRDVVHLARLALEGGVAEAPPLVRRMARRANGDHPDLSQGLINLLRESPVRSAAVKGAVEGRPVDLESRSPLIKEEAQPLVAVDPVFENDLSKKLQQLVRERGQREKLARAGLAPTRTALFVGPPGVGKTLAARWLAMSLNVPLLTLDLSTVMSSYLGRTGDNLRRVLDYARTKDCILFLDEFDSIAKRRDDAADIGELKRLVTVLLQEVDYWPEGSLLVAATNHGDLLDPAIWRRFEIALDFTLPSATALSVAAQQYIDDPTIPEAIFHFIGRAFEGRSFSDLEQSVKRVRRRSALDGSPLVDDLIEDFGNGIRERSFEQRIALATYLTDVLQVSQHKAHELTGVSRDTMRKRGTSK